MTKIEGPFLPENVVEKEEISNEALEKWIAEIRNGNDFYVDQIKIGLEWRDPIAVSFLHKVAEADPLVALSRFDTFLDILNED